MATLTGAGARRVRGGREVGTRWAGREGGVEWAGALEVG